MGGIKVNETWSSNLVIENFNRFQPHSVEATANTLSIAHHIRLILRLRLLLSSSADFSLGRTADFLHPVLAFLPLFSAETFAFEQSFLKLKNDICICFTTYNNSSIYEDPTGMAGQDTAGRTGHGHRVPCTYLWSPMGMGSSPKGILYQVLRGSKGGPTPRPWQLSPLLMPDQQPSNPKSAIPYPLKTIFRFELLQIIHIVVNESETGRSAAAELRTKSETDDNVGRGLVHFGQSFRQISFRNAGFIRMEDIQDLKKEGNVETWTGGTGSIKGTVEC